jgi:hypothetical protein
VQEDGSQGERPEVHVKKRVARQLGDLHKEQAGSVARNSGQEMVLRQVLVGEEFVAGEMK